MQKRIGGYLLLVIMLAGMTVFTGCKKQNTETMEKDLKAFITEFEGKYIPLYKKVTLADWDAQISGKEEDFKKLKDE